MTTKKHSFTKERILLFTLAVIQFTNIMDFMIMMPLGPQLMRTFNINPQQFGFALSAYTFSAGIFGFLGAFFIDKFDRKTALMYIYIGFTIGTFICGISNSYYILLFARIFTGMFGGILGALVLSIVGDAIPLERRATAMGTVMAAFSFASVMGLPVGLYLAATFSWQMPFLFLGGLGLVVVLLINFFVPSMTAHLSNKKADATPFTFLINIAHDRNQVMALFLMIFMMLSQFSYLSMLSPYLVANVGFSEKDLTYVYFIGGAFTLISAPVSGQLADKYGRALIFTIFSICAMIPMLLLTNLTPTSMWIVLVITTLNFIFISSRMIPSSTMITATVLPQQRGGFMSINSSVQQLASGTAVFLSGFIIYKDASGHIINYNLIGYFAFFCAIIAIVIGNRLKAVDIKKPVEVFQE